MSLGGEDFCHAEYHRLPVSDRRHPLNGGQKSGAGGRRSAGEASNARAVFGLRAANRRMEKWSSGGAAPVLPAAAAALAGWKESGAAIGRDGRRKARGAREHRSLPVFRGGGRFRSRSGGWKVPWMRPPLCRMIQATGYKITLG